MRWPRSVPPDAAVARREAERQVEWAEAYLAAVEGIDLHDTQLQLEASRLRAAVTELRLRLSRPRVL